MRGAGLVSFAMILAGCVSTSPTSSPEEGPTPASPGWALDCTLGSYESGPWHQDCVARASHTQGSKTEIWLAVNPTDPNNVVLGAKDLNPESSDNCVWNGVSVTKDGGMTWTDVTIGGRFADRQPAEPFFGYACNTDPMFAFSADGTLHYGVEMYNLGPNIQTPQGEAGNPAGWKVLLATSRDGGLSWPQVITFWNDLLTITDYSRMAVSPSSGTLFEAINTAGAGFTCSLLSSRDEGMTAEPPLEVTPPEAAGRSFCRALAAGPDGTLVVAFRELDPAAPEIETGRTWFVRSTDDGQTWIDANEGFTFDPVSDFEENEFRTGTNLEMAYAQGGPSAGTLYAIYASDEAGNADVSARWSTDHGATWSGAVRVNDDAGSNDQWMPNVVVASDGSVHAFFMDKRHDAGNKLIDMTHAWSEDGGMTWSNERVTTRSFDGDLGVHQDGYPFIGDYLGIGAAGDEVWGGFPDASRGDVPVTAAARVFKQG